MGGDFGAPASSAILDQLRRILESSDFQSSERNRRFLSYVVDETLAGRADRIKAYSVATSVFDRDDTFDPQADPIVRIEASRLRRSLDRYYLTAGRDDRVLITIPKGSYVPGFATVPHELFAPSGPIPEGDREASRAPRAHPLRSRIRASYVTWGAAVPLVAVLTWLGVSWFGHLPPFSNYAGQAANLRNGPAIFVAPFDNDGSPPEHGDLARGLTREVIRALTRFNSLFIFGPETTFRYGTDSAGMAADLGVDFILSGGTTVSSGGLQVTASLINAKSGQYVWSGKFEAGLQAAEIIKVRDDIASQVARELAQPYGVIFNQQVKEIEGRPPKSFTSYECVLQFYRYWRTYSADLYAPVHECLERAIVADPDYADAYASLSIVYADAYRFKLDKGAIAGDPLARATELAQRAVELAPNSAHSYQALHLVYWLAHDVERSLEAAERGLALNPNDTNLMAELGLRYSMVGRWDKGVALVKEAYARNPAQPTMYRLALFLEHYRNGRYEEALAEAKKVDTPGIIYGHIARAMAYAQLGRDEEATFEVKAILAADPAYGENVVRDLEQRNVYPALVRMIVDGLEKAGLSANRQSRNGS